MGAAEHLRPGSFDRRLGDGESFHLWEVEDGCLRRLHVSYDRHAADAAAGLAGRADAPAQAK